MNITFVLLQFHPELNPIEGCWGKAKQYAHANCDYSFESLQGIASAAVASVSLDLVWKYFRKVHDYHRAYMEGKGVLEAQSLDQEVQVPSGGSTIRESVKTCARMELLKHNMRSRIMFPASCTSLAIVPLDLVQRCICKIHGGLPSYPCIYIAWTCTFLHQRSISILMECTYHHRATHN